MDSYNALIFGRRGSGKTSLIAGDDAIPFTGLLALAGKPVFVLDTVDTINRGLYFRTVVHLRDFILAERRGEVENETGIYTVKSTSSEVSDDFLRFCNLYRLPCTVVIDEVSRFTRGKIEPDLYELVHYGRNWGANIIAGARRPTEVHPDWRSQVDAVVTFQQRYAGDIAKITDSKYAADIVANLDGHEFTVLGYVAHLPFMDALRTVEEYVPSTESRG